MVNTAGTLISIIGLIWDWGSESQSFKACTVNIGERFISSSSACFLCRQKDNIKIENWVIGVELMYTMAGVGVSQSHTETF